jgi:DNA-directed RNA polymerase subunit N (RpoN/RPB10)
MLTPVVCLTCGCALGDKEDLFRHLRGARVREVLAARGTTATQAAADAGLQIDCSDILTLLGIPEERECCRGHLVSAMIFFDYY